jgi:hypothetical protein
MQWKVGGELHAGEGMRIPPEPRKEKGSCIQGKKWVVSESGKGK